MKTSSTTLPPLDHLYLFDLAKRLKARGVVKNVIEFSERYTNRHSRYVYSLKASRAVPSVAVLLIIHATLYAEGHMDLAAEVTQMMRLRAETRRKDITGNYGRARPLEAAKVESIRQATGTLREIATRVGVSPITVKKYIATQGDE